MMSPPNSSGDGIRHDSAKAFALLNCDQGGRSVKGAQLFQARRFAAAVTASLLIASGFFVPVNVQAQSSSNACEDAAGLVVLPSPVSPWKGAPLRVVFAVEKPIEGQLSLIAPDGSVAAKSRGRFGGPPYFWFAEVAAPAAGTWRATLTSARGGCGTITREIAVRDDKPPPLSAASGSVWPLRNTWNRATEDLFSAWIEKLFDAPLDAAPSWTALHEVLRDRSRNFLFNHLGLGEDEMGIVIRPDCADLPYFLRAYFAFKMGLPFGYAKCSRGRRRSTAEVLPVVQRPEYRSSTCRFARPKGRDSRTDGGQRTRPCNFVWPLSADDRRCSPLRIRANGSE